MTTEPHEIMVMEFRGNAREYFGIWMVNLLLTILTLGIYSPWAKVRKLRYFYNNTVLADAGFDFTGRPWAILRGRLLAFGCFVVYSVCANLVPVLSLPLFLLLFLATPWLVVRGLLFNRHNTTYRNLRFGFTADYRQAAWVYIAAPLIGVLTLGLGMPYAGFRALQFKLANSLYGQSRFTFHASLKQYYAALAKGVMISTLFLILLLAGFTAAAVYFNLATAISDLAQSIPANAESHAHVEAALLAVIGYLALFFFGSVYYHVINACVSNLALSNTRLADLKLQSSMNPWTVTWIAISNVVAVLFSLGLLHPWAKIRMYRYRLGRLAVSAPAGFDQFLAGQASNCSATGEELADLFDVDIAL